MRLRVELFGDPAFTFDGAPWRLAAPPKSLPLLALIALHREPVGRASLATALWPDDPEPEARANLRRHLHALVKALPESDEHWIKTAGQTVAWNPNAPAFVDIVEFERLLENSATYDRAVKLYRGDLLAGSFDEAIIGERERLRGAHLQALYELAQQARAARDFSAAAAHAEAILAVDEWREDALRLLMSVRYAMGDRSGALAAFERFARRLREELHADPMFETAAMREAILNDTIPADDHVVQTRTVTQRPLVGRDAVLEELQHSWLRAAHGSGWTVFVAGEAGIGKSRLAQELLATIETQGGRTVVGRTSQPESMPYQPLIEVLRQIVPFIKREPRDDRWLHTLAPLVPEVARLLARSDEPVMLEGERGTLRLQDAMLRAIEACARVRPVAILLEDLHWANAGTLDMIGSIAERLSPVSAVLVLTYRSTEAGAESPIRALRRSLQCASRASHITLPRLDAADVARIVTLADDAAPADLADRVFAMSEGNPLFIWQLIHQFSERSSHLDRHAAIASVGDAILTRFSLLPADVRTVADVAATIGDTFSIEEIAAVGGWDESTVFGALATLLDRQLVAERAGDAFEYGFTHALIGSAIYEATQAAARAVRHRRAAEVLQRTRVSFGRGYALVAQHWDRASEPGRARAVLLEGAQWALRNYARADARELAQRVLEAGAQGRERFQALQILVAATDRAGATATAERAVQELETLAESLDASEQYQALVTRIRFHEHHTQRTEQKHAIERLRTFAGKHDNDVWRVEAALRDTALTMQRGGTADGERMLSGLGDPERITDANQRYRYYSHLAQSQFRQGKYETGIATMRAFRAYLETHPSLEGESFYAYADLKYAWLLEDALEIKRAASRYVELAQRRGDILDEANGRIDLAYTYHQLYDTSSARAEFERCLELFARCHAWQGWANTRINMGVMERETGHIERGFAYQVEGQQKARDVGVRFAVVVVDGNLSEWELQKKNYKKALEYAMAATERIRGTGEHRLQSESDAILGISLCANGSIDEGLRIYERGLEGSRAMKQPRTLAAHLMMFIETMLDVQYIERMEAYMNELRSLFEAEPHDQQHPGRIGWAIAGVLRHLGRDDEAAAMIERTRDVLQSRLETFTEPADRMAYASMHPNDKILGARVTSGERVTSR